MKELLTAALSFTSSHENRSIIAYIEYSIGDHQDYAVVLLQAPSTQDVMQRVFLLNKAGMNIFNVKFL